MFKFLATTISASDVGIPVRAANATSMVAILNTVYWVAGVVGVIVIIIAGFLYVTSTGDPSKTKRAKDAILYAVVGLVIIVLAFTITQIVLGSTK